MTRNRTCSCGCGGRRTWGLHEVVVQGLVMGANLDHANSTWRARSGFIATMLSGLTTVMARYKTRVLPDVVQPMYRVVFCFI